MLDVDHQDVWRELELDEKKVYGVNFTLRALFYEFSSDLLSINDSKLFVYEGLHVNGFLPRSFGYNSELGLDPFNVFLMLLEAPGASKLPSLE